MILAFNPAGGSLVNLIDLSKIPIGTFLEGSADKNNLNYEFPTPASEAIASIIFSNSTNQLGIK